MARYSAVFQKTAATGKTVAQLNAVNTTALRRFKIFDIMIGSEDTPADNAFLHQFQRYTVAGTGGTAVVPQPLDAADAAAMTVGAMAPTVEPTYTAAQFLLTFALNQKATFRWCAAPGSELVCPGVTANGIGHITTIASAVKVTTEILIDEQ